MEAHGASHGNFHGNLHGKIHGILHDNLHGNPRQASTAYHGRPRYNGKTQANAYVIGVAMEYAVAVDVVLPWVVMVGTTEAAMDRTAARAMATTVALAVEAHGQWKPGGLAVETRDLPR